MCLKHYRKNHGKFIWIPKYEAKYFFLIFYFLILIIEQNYPEEAIVLRLIIALHRVVGFQILPWTYTNWYKPSVLCNMIWLSIKVHLRHHVSLMFLCLPGVAQLDNWTKLFIC